MHSLYHPNITLLNNASIHNISKSTAHPSSSSVCRHISSTPSTKDPKFEANVHIRSKRSTPQRATFTTRCDVNVRCTMRCNVRCAPSGWQHATLPRCMPRSGENVSPKRDPASRRARARSHPRWPHSPALCACMRKRSHAPKRERAATRTRALTCDVFERGAVFARRSQNDTVRTEKSHAVGRMMVQLYGNVG